MRLSRNQRNQARNLGSHEQTYIRAKTGSLLGGAGYDTFIFPHTEHNERLIKWSLTFLRRPAYGISSIDAFPP